MGSGYLFLLGLGGSGWTPFHDGPTRSFQVFQLKRGTISVLGVSVLDAFDCFVQARQLTERPTRNPMSATVSLQKGNTNTKLFRGLFNGKVESTTKGIEIDVGVGARRLSTACHLPG